MEPHRELSEVLDLLGCLPSGCALFRDMGGDDAFTLEALFLREIEYDVRALGHGLGGGKGTPPKKIPAPEPAHLVRAREQRADEKLQRFLARHSA
ncbi:hypothetical protein [Microbacterium sp. ZXX196]|uniref:hypothetical protein n=1 Tax=Microbacterium sp. ZXX196 TaxID=2609291 RepID=UPI0012B9909C|nr:hypothetical protein [Microbacterium sp. ZXX196]MTE24826.1 hypothetical protein [Microbacterium sp. ZXX196]